MTKILGVNEGSQMITKPEYIGEKLSCMMCDNE